MVSDPIADMLTRIRNAAAARKRQVVVPSSKVKVGLAKILAEEGFISDYAVSDDSPQPNLVMRLKYIPGSGAPIINGLERVSKPGRRIYTGFAEIPWVRSGLGMNVISTPKGLMTGRRARRARLGGEIICNVW